MIQTAFATPIGTIRIEATGERITALRIGKPEDPVEPSNDPLLGEATRQIAAWFDGRIEHFDLPFAATLSPRGADLRAGIQSIGYGCTASYGDVARATGSSPRAIGQACARNSLPIIVPCHRVVGAAGAIGHYSAGSGSTTKRWLLAFEARRSLWAR